MLGYLSIICSEKRTVFLELRSRKAFRFSEQITSADKYRSMFSRQMEVIVYIVEQTGDDNKGIPQIQKILDLSLNTVVMWQFKETVSPKNVALASLIGVWSGERAIFQLWFCFSVSPDSIQPLFTFNLLTRTNGDWYRWHILPCNMQWSMIIAIWLT